MVAEPVHHIQTADAVVAEDNDGRLAGLVLEGLQVLGDGLHRDEVGAFNSRDFVLEGLADVDKGELLTQIEAAFDVFYCDFHSSLIIDRPG